MEIKKIKSLQPHYKLSDIKKFSQATQLVKGHFLVANAGLSDPNHHPVTSY